MLSINFTKKISRYTLHVNIQMENEIVILFAPSGTGKTTILHCIAGIMQPDAGVINVGDNVLFEKNHNKKKSLPIQKRDVGYVFQDYALFPHMTVKKNIMYALKEEQVMNGLVKELGVAPLLHKYPQQISGGEKQRVALARALAAEPKVLLLDEPFSSLDIDTRRQCGDLLRHMQGKMGIPVLMVTHDRQEALELGHRFVTIQDGTVTTLDW
ncbi:ATP-binding cassette domain-containing protein [Longirhabdus pacifica]|uniref:ATP-binding cassette domain-containing protein n=1 Tax=Longirhabdus pacifica TaxID=2305227 RepID=UPI00100890DD|nr:ATP-binding cassette domain-containing protein [Longirhabdus pacifica]